MIKQNIYSPFNEILEQFTILLEPMFSQITELTEKRTIQKSANAFIDSILNESIKKDAVSIITDDVLKTMPKGIWNVETIGLVEDKLKLIFDDDFMTRLKSNPQFNIEDPIKRSYFLKQILSTLLGTQISGFKFMRNQMRFASIHEKDKINIRLGREMVETLDLMNDLSKNVLIKMKKTKDVTSDKFSEIIQKYWTAHTLLFLRVLDVVLTYNENKEKAIKKMNFLSVERIRIGSYC
ncbi:MAG: hypothetical protein U9R34_05870 [Nanoarchaeota archaeon]|nr:hypothetical protein [Nanoarchaeota archaeon]